MLYFFLGTIFGLCICIGVTALLLKSLWREFLWTANDNGVSPGRALNLILKKRIKFDFGNYVWKRERKSEPGLRLIK